METIIKKLNDLEYNKNMSKKWSLKEIKQLLEIYFIIYKNESYIFDLIYEYHDTNSYESIFLNYQDNYLLDKASGVEEALNNINEKIKTKEK
jgi:hypothetical protein